MGKINFAASQQLAHAAFLDGANQKEIVSLAQTGAWGEYPSHVRRDIERQLFSKIPFSKPCEISTMAINSKSNETIPVKVSCFLPHLVIDSLSHYQCEHDAVFRVGLLERFWNSVRPNDPKLVALFAETSITHDELKSVVPLLVHGDGVEYLENDSLEVQSFGPLLGSGESLDCFF